MPGTPTSKGWLAVETTINHLEWDGPHLADNLIGLSWPDPAQGDGNFAAAVPGKVVLVPVECLGGFITAHPEARYIVDLDGPHGLDLNVAEVHTAVVENRVLDISLLQELVTLAAPGVKRPLLERPDGSEWAKYCVQLRDEAARLLAHAEAAEARVEANPALGRSFGPLALGLDVRGALAATGAGSGIRLTPGGLQRVTAALDERERVARAELTDIPAAKSFANTGGGRNFLNRGDLGDDPGAIRAFVGSIIRGVRMRDRLPVPGPADPAHLISWDLLVPHSRAAAAASELRKVHEVREALVGGEPIRPRVTTFPEFQTSNPDLSYIKRVAGNRLFSPVDGGNRFLVVALPDLELRTLAICLERRYGDDTLNRAILDEGVASVRLKVALAFSGLEVDQFLARLGTDEGRRWNELAAAVLKFVPLGVADRTLESWLLMYFTGTAPSAARVRAARQSFDELAPSLSRYVTFGALQVISDNMGVSVGELTDALATMAADLGLQAGAADITKLLDLLLQNTTGDGSSAGDRLFTLFATDKYLPGNRLAARPYRDQDELVRELLAMDYSTPTGRVYGGALPLQVVGRDHVELADGIRKVVYYALVAGGFPVAAFDDEEFVVVIPDDGNADASKRRAAESVRGVLAGWAGWVADSVTSAVSTGW